MIADCDGSNQIATNGCEVPSGKDGSRWEEKEPWETKALIQLSG